MIRKLMMLLLLLSGMAWAQFPAGDDVYGGISSLPCTTTSTGFFHTSNYNNYEVFCDPLNNVWVPKGIWVVTNSPSGAVDDRGNNYGTITTSRYGTSAAWADATAQRIQSWGFNFTGTSGAAFIRAVATDSSYPLDGSSIHSIPHKIPFASDLRPDYYGMRNAFWYLTDPEKDLFAARSPRYSALGGFVNNNGFGDSEDPKYTTELAGELVSSFGNIWYTIGHSTYNPYMVGGFISDSDQLWFYGAGQDFATSPAGHNTDHLGWFVLTMSPFLSANSANANFKALYQDNVVYAKQHAQQLLINKYGKIANLNTAWGSTYTTFGSSGTTITGEAYGTGDGATTTFAHTAATLNPTAFTAQVKDNGTVICGDNGSGTMYGPRCTGTINYTTGAISVTWDTTTRSFTSVQGTSGTATLIYGSGINQLGAVVGETVTIAGTTNYNGTYTILSAGATSNVGYYLTFALAGTFAKETIGTFAFPAPASGKALVLNYVANGWGTGTGLMDEDGRPAHTWVGTNTGGFGNAEINGTAGFNADASMILQSTATDYFSTNRATFKAQFPNHLYLGPDTFGTWGTPPRKEVLLAASQYIDTMESGGQTNFSSTELNFIHTYLGDKPIIQGQYMPANEGSPFSYPNSTASRTGSAVTLTTTRTHNITTTKAIHISGCSDATFNITGSLTPTSVTTNTATVTLAGAGSSATGCNVTFDATSVGGFASQAARASQLQTNINNLLSATNQLGIHPNTGFMWWRWSDDWSENLNWGLVSVMDNAYDGVEDVSATGVTCSSPINSFATCGGENANYGDLISTVKTVISGMDAAMVSAVGGGTTNMHNVTVSGGVTVH